MRTGSAEARRHHELRQDSRNGAGAEEHGPTGAVDCNKCRPVPEGDQPEWTFSQNCRQEELLVHTAQSYSSTTRAAVSFLDKRLPLL